MENFNIRLKFLLSCLLPFSLSCTLTFDLFCWMHSMFFDTVLTHLPKLTLVLVYLQWNGATLLRPNSSNVADRNSSGRNFDKLPQQMQHFVSHMEIRDYPILIQPDGVCGAGAKYERERPLLLMAIKSTELNLENRQAIRRTWGAEGGAYVRRVFLLGKEPPEGLNEDFPGLLRMESKLYGDILQWDFEDTFFNLTLKDVLFWSWFSGSCGRTRFVFKGDDDVFVNTPKLITYLQDQLKEPQARDTMKGFMVGNVIGAASPVRVNSSKYFIPVSFYKGLYPAYAGGGGVVYSSLLTKRLLNTSKRVLLFPIDDVYVGMCMVRLNLCPSHHPAFLTFDFPAKEEEQPCAYHRVLLVHKRSPMMCLTVVCLLHDPPQPAVIPDQLWLLQKNPAVTFCTEPSNEFNF
uniref:Hexosyltransferase n=1 Tax=Scophthalmus maximus TaxID=52904 RepID=A0A8D3EEP2_SCOMX